MLLSQKNKHERDERIEFQENGHRYFIDGITEGTISATGLVHKWFPQFDADVVIAKMKASPNWATNRYSLMTDDEIKLEWEQNKNLAANAGTIMHNAIENYFNGMPYEDDSVEFLYFLLYVHDFNFNSYRTEWFVYD